MSYTEYNAVLKVKRGLLGSEGYFVWERNLSMCYEKMESKK